MDAETLFRIGQNLVLVPVIRDAAREGDHLAQGLNLALQRLPLTVLKCAGFGSEFVDELTTFFGDDFDGVGCKKLIVAECRRDRAGVFVVFEACFDVVTAVSGGLETVNPHHLVLGQSSGLSHLGIDLFELDIVLRHPRNEIELLLSGGNEIGDDRYGGPTPRRFRFQGIRGFGGPV